MEGISLRTDAGARISPWRIEKQVGGNEGHHRGGPGFPALQQEEKREGETPGAEAEETDEGCGQKSTGGVSSPGTLWCPWVVHVWI